MSAWRSRNVHVVHVVSNQEHSKLHGTTIPVQDRTGMELRMHEPLDSTFKPLRLCIVPSWEVYISAHTRSSAVAVDQSSGRSREGATIAGTNSFEVAVSYARELTGLFKA